MPPPAFGWARARASMSLWAPRAPAPVLLEPGWGSEQRQHPRSAGALASLSQEAPDVGVDASALLGAGAAGFILCTFSRGPPALLLFVRSRLFSFSVLFVALKRFP